MTIEPRPELDALTDADLEASARALAERAGLRTPVGGKDPRDFIQEAVRKVLAGERTLSPDRSLRENLIQIGQSLIWNERKKGAAAPLGDTEIEAPTTDRMSAEQVVHLHAGLDKARRVLASPSDARAFVDGLIERIETGGSIKPGHLARHLGWNRERAYAAWRKVKAALRAHFGERKR